MARNLPTAAVAAPRRTLPTPPPRLTRRPSAQRRASGPRGERAAAPPAHHDTTVPAWRAWATCATADPDHAPGAVTRAAGHAGETGPKAANHPRPGPPGHGRRQRGRAHRAPAPERAPRPKHHAHPGTHPRHGRSRQRPRPAPHGGARDGTPPPRDGPSAPLATRHPPYRARHGERVGQGAGGGPQHRHRHRPHH
jgi:hypothetical protein